MESPIEKTQRKSKKCARFFSNEAALKQYHCKEMSHCGQVINCADNFKKHLRSCEKVPTHTAKQQ